MTNREALINGQNRLKEAGIEEYESDALLLFEHVTGISYSQMFIKGSLVIEDKQLEDYNLLLERRKDHVPVQHLTGVQNFMGYDFKVNENVLVPRFDTEILVEYVLKYIKRAEINPIKLLDICTGSGCIIISLVEELLRLINNSEDICSLKELGITAVATDISDKALEIARENASTYAADEIQFVQTDLISGIEGTFDIIVSNPPYIETKVIETLSPEVRDMEPRLALDGGEDGLIFYRRLAIEAVPKLKDNGLIAVEIGYNQGQEVRELFEKAGLDGVEIIKDYAGLDRVVAGIKHTRRN